MADSPARVLRVTAGSIRLVGRGPLADFVLDASLVSRMHCRLSATDATLRVDDLDSTNGTFVNDQRVTTAVLHDGDRLRLGRLELTVARADPEELGDG